MVTLKPVDIGMTFPYGEFGFLFMHPFIKLTSSEPFRWVDDEKDKQLQRICRCLGIARSASLLDKIHFVVFPEYSIPGLEGIARVQDTLGNIAWQDELVVIAGIDGLTKREYSTLCQAEQTYVSQQNKPEVVNEALWVNCAVTWLLTKDQNCNRVIKRWIQPKLCPSWLQERIHTQHMFEGKTVFVFEGHFPDGRAFRFFSLLCYDWVAPVVSGGLNRLLELLNESWKDSPDGKFVHLVFVLQHNEKPNHTSFLNNALLYFNEQYYTYVNTRDSIVAFVNTAGSPDPGPAERYGFSSLVYSPYLGSDLRASPPSYAISTRRLRQSDVLQTCRDVLFRENGACIHCIYAFNPRTLQRTPTQTRRLPLRQVLVHGLDEDNKDPRTPGKPVSAVIKWTNDRLDQARHLEVGVHDLHLCLKSKLDVIINEIRWCEHARLEEMLRYCMAHVSDPQQAEPWLENIDEWSDEEESSLQALLHALSMINCWQTIRIKDASAHAYMVCGSDVIDIIVVAGPTHSNNLRHVDRVYPGHHGRRTLIISRDKDDTPLTPRDKLVYDMTDTKRCGLHDLKSCLSAANLQEFASKLKNVIGL